MLRQEALRIANELSLEGFHASPGYLANFMRRAGVEMWCAFVWLPFIEFFCGTVHGEEEINPLHAAFLSATCANFAQSSRRTTLWRVKLRQEMRLA